MNTKKIDFEKIEFRPMKEADLPQVSALEEASFSSPWSLKSFADALQKDYYFFAVAVVENEIIAQAGLTISFDEADVSNVAVKENQRRQGIAHHLMEYLLKQGEERGVNAFTLEVREHNLPAIALYHDFGFCDEGIRKNFYQNPTENAIIMWKRNK